VKSVRRSTCGANDLLASGGATIVSMTSPHGRSPADTIVEEDVAHPATRGVAAVTAGDGASSDQMPQPHDGEDAERHR
jgi:hypothetical protein